VAGWNANIAGHPLERYCLDYKKRFREDFGFMAYKYFVEMLARAIDKAGAADVKYDADDTGFGWKTDVRIEAKDNILPTTCRMERP
jgi:hypothetical protein